MAFANIRTIIGELIGKRVIDITQHDPDEFKEEGGYVMLMFDDGSWVKFPIDGKGFTHNCWNHLGDGFDPLPPGLKN